MDVLNDVKAPDFVGIFFSAPDEKLKSVVAWEYSRSGGHTPCRHTLNALLQLELTVYRRSSASEAGVEDLRDQRGAYQGVNSPRVRLSHHGDLSFLFCAR